MLRDSPSDEDLKALNADSRTHRIICDWIRQDAPLAVKMSVMPEHVAALVRRLSAKEEEGGRDAG